MTCADCSQSRTVMVVLRAPRGEWFLCSRCWRASAREAEVDRRAREAKIENLSRRETKPKARVGSHG